MTTATCAAGDAANGKALYESRCIACHSIDASRVGPAHRGVVGRKAGSVRDYDYSPAVKASRVVWNTQTLDRWQGLIVQGDRGTVVREFSRDIAGYDEAAIDELARSPVWEARRQIVPTVPRELRAEQEHRFAVEAPRLAPRAVEAGIDDGSGRRFRCVRQRSPGRRPTNHHASGNAAAASTSFSPSHHRNVAMPWS